MNRVLIIANNTFREIARDRILYGLFVLTILLVGMSLALGQLSFAEQVRISANFGLTAIHMGAMVLAVFVGSTLVSREIEKKTIFTLLVRPITRFQFLLGKSAGLLNIVLFSVSTLGLMLALVLVGLGLTPKLNYLIALLGVLLEAVVMLGVTLFFSSFASSITTVSMSVGVFLIGHWSQSLRYFIEKSESAAFKFFGNIIAWIFPDLERFNWRDIVVYNEMVPAAEVFWALAYALVWFSFFITLTSVIVCRRDFN